MGNLNRHPVRRTAAGVLAGALALSGAVAAATPVNAAAGFNLERIAGADRYQTSAAIADRFGPAPGAILASGEAGRFPDALSANSLAGVRGVPVLLTMRDQTPAVILAALNRLVGKNVTIVGGTDVVSAAQESSLRTAGFTVSRIGGADRYVTSQLVVAAGRAGNATATIGILATGQEFADALAAGPRPTRASTRSS